MEYIIRTIFHLATLCTFMNCWKPLLLDNNVFATIFKYKIHACFQEFQNLENIKNLEKTFPDLT